ncbi:MAG TPA: lysoplasmalogenase [Aggregatilineales bacterium]|nr:lysoplasmalogenase [Aggregatilineales bacterium]
MTLPLLSRAILWLIVLVIALLNIGSFFLGPFDPQRAGRIKKIAQLPQSALLVLFAAIVALNSASDGNFATLAVLVLCGMLVGFVGDLFMANVFHQKDHVLFGMAAFGIGHLCYVLAFREIAVRFGLSDPSYYVLPEIVLCLLGVVLWAQLVRKPGGSQRQYVALLYALFLSGMAGYSLGLALQQPAFLPLALGATLFVVSDTLIAAQLFAERSFPFVGDVVWVTYIVAQILIVSVVPISMSQ